MSVVKNILGWFYENWGPASQAIIGLLAIVLGIRPAKVAALEERRWWKVVLPVGVAFIVVTGLIQSWRSDTELRTQVRTMYSRSTLEATKDDIGSLTSDINSGFRSILDAVNRKSGKAPAIEAPIQIPLALPAPPHTTWTQARTLSGDPELKSIQVTIQSDQPVPASFAIECTGPVSRVHAFLVGQGVLMSVMFGTSQENPNIAIVRIGFPQLTPQSPLVVTLSSRDDIRVKGIEPYRQ